MTKVSLILLCSLCLDALLRKQSAAMRHWALAAAIACAAASPLLELVVPSWHLQFGAAQPAQAIETSDVRVATPDVSSREAAAPVPAAGARSVVMTIAGPVLPAVWIAGAAISLFVLLVGLVRLTWLAAGSQPLRQGVWTEIADDISRELGLRRRVLLLQSDHPTLLVTWGLWRSKIILPAAAREWTGARAQVVLSHEIAHIQRRDWLVQMVAELLRAVYWFNPLVWIAGTRLRQESERACDDAVLKSGIEGPDYAAHLLDLARVLKPRSRAFPALPAPAIARPSSLERRISAMLNARLNRTPITRSARIATVFALLTMTVPIAGFVASAQSASATWSGSVLDQVGRILPDTSLVLVNTQSQTRYGLRSDQVGHFELRGLPAGTYLLEANIPGFEYAQGTFTFDAGQQLRRDIALQVGSIEETVTVTDRDFRPPLPPPPPPPSAATTTGRAAGVPPPPPPPPPPPAPRAATSQPAFDRCSQSLVGGCIRPPLRLAGEPPAYPSTSRDAKVEGKVVLEGRIGTDGLIKDLRVQTPVDADLARAAFDAVQQWQYTATQLSGVPIEVSISVTVNFSSVR